MGKKYYMTPAVKNRIVLFLIFITQNRDLVVLSLYFISLDDKNKGRTKIQHTKNEKRYLCETPITYFPEQ